MVSCIRIEILTIFLIAAFNQDAFICFIISFLAYARNTISLFLVLLRCVAIAVETIKVFSAAALASGVFVASITEDFLGPRRQKKIVLFLSR